jgi:hypothetical protein
MSFAPWESSLGKYESFVRVFAICKVMTKLPKRFTASKKPPTAKQPDRFSQKFSDGGFY